MQMTEKLNTFQNAKAKLEKLTILGGALVVVGILLFVALANNGPFGLIATLPGIGVLIYAMSKMSALSKEFKRQVLADLVKESIDQGQLLIGSGLSQSQVMDTEFLKRPDRFHSEDFISGSMDGVSFVSSDVKLEEKHVHHTKNGTRTEWVTYFLGRVFVFEFNKRFDGALQVAENTRPTTRKKYGKIKMESIEFNKVYKTYTTNDHTAFYVLTPHLMQALLDFEKNNKGHISFSFIGSKLYIAINNFRDTFELRMFRKVDQSTVDEFKRDLLVIHDVVRELRLNKKIFLKE
jgi:hypothetical protein